MTTSTRAGFALLSILALIAVLGPLLAGSPYAQGNLLTEALHAPSAAHWLGTDQFARDVLARFAWGARNSLGIAAIAVMVATAIGSLLGLLAGSTEGVVSGMLRRLIDVGLALPRVIVLLVLIAATGRLSTPVLAVVIGLTGWPGMARLVRGETLRLRHAPYVLAARALGARPARVLLRDIFPGTLAPMLVAATLGVADAILLEAGLSFLGLGLPLPEPSWGGMLLDAREYLGRAPWLLFFPAAGLVLATSTATLLGETLRRSLQPDSR
ncbi:MAG: ABC transporter permease [Gemmatimonadota bacterium]